MNQKLGRLARVDIWRANHWLFDTFHYHGTSLINNIFSNLFALMLTNRISCLGCRIPFNSVMVVSVGLIHHAKIS